MTNSSQTFLNPDSFSSSIKAFLTYFNLEEKKPDLHFLNDILNVYTRFPYENLSKIIKLEKDFLAPERIRLPDEILEDHFRHGLGGTCFSLTFMLYAILLKYGYRSYPVIAHMRNRKNEHCALVVYLDNKYYLLDPGYLLTRPMELNKDNPRLYHTFHTGIELRFDKQTELFHLFTFDRQQIKWRYCFKNRAVSMKKFLEYWHASFYRGTMHGICITQIKKDGMVYLHNNYLQISNSHGKQKQKIKKDLNKEIHKLFGIEPELVEQAMDSLKKNMHFEKKYEFYRPKKESPDGTL